MVFAMRLSSSLVERVSEVTIWVPSDRTTRSKGVINNANGRLQNGISMCCSLAPWIYSRDALNDHKSNESLGSNSTVGSFLVIL
jgi:hypothetical protein